jgi:hypothetical protein
MTIAHAFNCSPSDAKAIANRSTAFHAAVDRLGPIRAWKRGKVWTLDGRRAEPAEFIEEADWLASRPARTDYEAKWLGQKPSFGGEPLTSTRQPTTAKEGE